MRGSEGLDKFVCPIIAACKAQFPRACSKCGREFADFKDFIKCTRPIGAPQLPRGSDDPMGMVSYVNCLCGTTLLLECNDARAHKMVAEAMAAEASARGQSVQELLLDIRAEVRRRMLEE